MKIGIIGSGNVGSALGQRWLQEGHDVTFGFREPASDRAKALLEKLGDRARGETLEGAARGAEVVLLATPWDATPSALASAGDLTGKVLLDCTNPLAADLSGLVIGHNTSGGEEVARLAPGARVVKIFNTTGADNMRNTARYGAPLTLLYAGDDKDANATASRLAAEIGFDPVHLGPLSAARALEPFALAWITLAFAGGLGPDFALQIVRPPHGS